MLAIIKKTISLWRIYTPGQWALDGADTLVTVVVDEAAGTVAGLEATKAEAGVEMGTNDARGLYYFQTNSLFL